MNISKVKSADSETSAPRIGGYDTLFEYLYRVLYTNVFPDYLVELKKACERCKTILDVGCGNNSLLRFFRSDCYSEGVDAFEPYIEESRQRGIHDKYHRLDVLDIGARFASRSFDCVLASDVIEHLEKKDGHKLIMMMERIAAKKVVIYTPNGFLPLGERDGNALYVHRSGWEVQEMRDLGFKITGLSGVKLLRGDDTGIRFRPRFFWRILSDLTQLYTKKHPEHAKQILCIKTVKG